MMKRHFDLGRKIAQINRSILLREAEEQNMQGGMSRQMGSADMSGMADDADFSRATPRQMGLVDDEEETMPVETQTDSEHSDAENIVSQIREMALQGLQTLANDIDDPTYDLFKKVWLLCDKAQTTEEEEEID